MEKLRDPGVRGQRAFASLVKATHDRLLGFIQRRLSSEKECLEVLMDVYVDIHSELKSLPAHEDLTAWAFALTHRRVLGRLADAEMLLPRNAIEKLLAKAIEALSDMDKQVYSLHDVEGFSLQETAKILNRPEEEVRSTLHGARLKNVNWVQEKMGKVQASA